jgi:hypothetical protein
MALKAVTLARSQYDDECYRHALRQSTAAGRYLIGTPRLDCTGQQHCVQRDPHVRERRTLLNFDKVVDSESDLKNLSRKMSDCPTAQYQGEGDAHAVAHVVPYRTDGACPAPRGVDLTTEDTRLSDPACNRRGTENGYNRWAWLPHGNPQCRAIQPFERLNSQRIIAKDTFRPCIPMPLRSSNAVVEHRSPPSPPSPPSSCAAWSSHQDWHPVSNHVKRRCQ